MRAFVVAVVASLLGLAAPSGTPLGATPCAAQPAPDAARSTPARDDEHALPGAGAALANEPDEEGDPAPAIGDESAFEAVPPPPDLLAGRVITSSSDRLADLVVVVSIDGLRADAVLTSHPTMSALAQQGTIAARALTIRRSTTLASHASMISGVDDDQHGLTWNSWRPNRPGILFPSALRIAARAGLDAALVVTKPKLQHLLGPWPDGVTLTQTRGSCTAVVRHAEEWLRTTRAGVALLHFPEPDSAGHRRGWMSNAYRAAVDQADRCLGDVVHALAARPQGRERVLLIVTADHGGHQRSHGTMLDVDRHIPWIAWGGAARSGVRIDRPVSTMDTAATVLDALGLPRVDGMRGQPVREALRLPDVRSAEARSGARASRRAARASRPPAPPRHGVHADTHPASTDGANVRAEANTNDAVVLAPESRAALAQELRSLDAEATAAQSLEARPATTRPAETTSNGPSTDASSDVSDR